MKRPRLRWMDDVKLDLRIMAVKNGETELLTEQNGHVMREAKANLRAGELQKTRKVRIPDGYI